MRLNGQGDNSRGDRDKDRQRDQQRSKQIGRETKDRTIETEKEVADIVVERTR
jgi:hypothetical protein